MSDLRALLERAVPFIEMAGYADTSGGEYPPQCLECGWGLHRKGCSLAAWLRDVAAALEVREEKPSGESSG